jgi:hypothetical protein
MLLIMLICVLHQREWHVYGHLFQRASSGLSELLPEVSLRNGPPATRPFVPLLLVFSSYFIPGRSGEDSFLGAVCRFSHLRIFLERLCLTRFGFRSSTWRSILVKIRIPSESNGSQMEVPMKLLHGEDA